MMIIFMKIEIIIIISYSFINIDTFLVIQIQSQLDDMQTDFHSNPLTQDTPTQISTEADENNSLKHVSSYNFHTMYNFSTCIHV